LRIVRRQELRDDLTSSGLGRFGQSTKTRALSKNSAMAVKPFRFHLRREP
jgi:hypothetical protein